MASREVYCGGVADRPPRQSASPLVLLKAGTCEPPLFIVPGLSGDPIEVLPLAKNMRCCNPVYGLRAPGFDGTDPPLHSVEDLASYYLPAIRTEQPHGPYFFAGYSFGGLVALEMARLLTERAQRPALLALLEAYPHPHRWPLSVRWGIVSRIATSRLTSLVRSPPSAVALYVAERVGRLGMRLHASEQAENGGAVFHWFSTAVPEGIHGPAAIVYAGCARAFARYQPRFYPGDVIFFQPRIRGSYPAEPTRIWRKLVERCDVRSVQGDHLSMVREESDDLAQQLAYCIRSSVKPEINPLRD